MRRAERARERRNRILTIGASVVIVAGLVVGGDGPDQARSPTTSSSTAATDSKSTGKFVDRARTASRPGARSSTQNHVTGDVKYPMEPPVGGDHNQVWMNCDGDVYTKAIKNDERRALAWSTARSG